MAISFSAALSESVLNNSGIKTRLDTGFLYLFAGPVPTNADEALNTGALHTQLAKFGTTAVADPPVGLTFDAPSGNVLPKAAAEGWLTLTAFDGVDSASSPLAPTFFRFCNTADNGRGAGDGTTYRIQGTVGGPADVADLNMATATLPNTAERSIGFFQVRLPA